MLKVAITGNIASGKSQVEGIIANYYPVYDADEIAHKFLGNVDRKELGKKVFADPVLRKQLEAEIHPKVKSEILKIFNIHSPSPRERGGVKVQQTPAIIFISVPLLFEANFDDMFDKIVFVSCNENTRLERLMKRNNLHKEDALARINAQLPEEEKIIKCDFVLDNNSDLSSLENQVLVLIRELESLI